MTAQHIQQAAYHMEVIANKLVRRIVAYASGSSLHNSGNVVHIPKRHLVTCRTTTFLDSTAMNRL
jgi:hypothetical protein